MPFEAIDSLSEKTREHLLGAGRTCGRAARASIKLPSGEKLIILNPTHGKNRHAATLMEEISHVFLGHKPSRLAIENKDHTGKTIARDYNNDIEEEAYGTGAAALIPYASLEANGRPTERPRSRSRGILMSAALWLNFASRSRGCGTSTRRKCSAADAIIHLHPWPPAETTSVPEMQHLTTVDKLRLLLDITKTICRSLDLEEVLNLVMDTLGSLIPYDAAGIYLMTAVTEHPFQVEGVPRVSDLSSS